MNCTKITIRCNHPKCGMTANEHRLMKGQPEGYVTTAKLQDDWTLVDSEYYCPEHSYPEDFDK